ncbi:hypothetical protein ACJ73_08675, partial [Blastomyces percursus]
MLPKAPCPYCGDQITLPNLAKHCDSKKRPRCGKLRAHWHNNTPAGSCPFCDERIPDLRRHVKYQGPQCHALRMLRKDNVHPIPTTSASARLTTSFNYPDLVLFTDNRIDNVFADNVKFLRKLLTRTQLAKPDKWLSLFPGQSTEALVEHEWAQRTIDYTLVFDDMGLHTALEAGLRYPVLIPAESALGQHYPSINDSPRGLSDMTLPQLLDLALWNGHTIDVQDHSAQTIEDFT